MANLQAGFARVDVTPPLGIEISGYFVERFASGILDALEASALALRCGDDQAILIALDNLMIDKETMHAYRAAIAERTGVKAEAVFIACSHTHTGPLVGKSELDENKYGEKEYGDYLGRKLCDCAVMAVRDMTDAKMGYAVGCAPHIAFVRRFRMKNGSIRTNPGVNNPDIVAPIGDVDERVNVHFMVGGTIANTTVIAAALRPWEGVIAADTGHINVHETGAIEASGHKVCAIEAPGGKLTPALVRELLRRHCDGQDEHMVLPRMVYISDATELGTIYTKSELSALHDVCREYGLYLFLDGARLPAALVAEGNDLAPADFAKYCDVFYIGGTKNGLLFGEALVITNDSLKPHFRNMIKQRGGMFAKGFLFGTQFKAYFEDDLWLTMARHAVTQAQRIQKAATEKGYSLYAVSPTNQVFLVLSHAQIERLKQNFAFELNGRVDEDHEAARFVCSWATKPEAVDALIAAL